jgi:hypothetical protein
MRYRVSWQAGGQSPTQFFALYSASEKIIIFSLVSSVSSTRAAVLTKVPCTSETSGILTPRICSYPLSRGTSTQNFLDFHLPLHATIILAINWESLKNILITKAAFSTNMSITSRFRCSERI